MKNTKLVEKLEKVQKLLALNEVEYCFSMDYDRKESVVENEYNSLKEAYDYITNCSTDELINYFGNDFINNFLKYDNLDITNNTIKEFEQYIVDCETASKEDKQNALNLIRNIR